MTVVTKYASGYRDPTSLKAIDAIARAAEIRMIKSRVSIANGDSATSRLYLGSIPSNAKINPGSTLYFGGLTGLTDFDIGLAYPNGGAVIVADCIVNGHDVHLAGSTTLLAATGSGLATPANIDKFVWQLAGLTADPGGELDVIGTMNTAATAAADIMLDMSYAKGA